MRSSGFDRNPKVRILESLVGQVDASSIASIDHRAGVDVILPITIYAAGNENAETMQLWIRGSRVKTWTDIGGNADARQSVAYQFNADSTVTADDIQVRFTNDRYENNGAIDNNLRVDRIVIDGTTFQTESPEVVSTGTWQNGSVTPGFKQDETLHVNGYFQYAGGGTNNNPTNRHSDLE